MEDQMSTKHGPKNQSNKGAAKKVAGKKVAIQGKTIVASATTTPEPVVEEAAGDAVADVAMGTEDPMDDCPGIGVTPDVPEVHVAQNAAAEGEPAAKPKRQILTIDDLRAKYLEVVGRETSSTNRSYLRWKVCEAKKGRVPVGPTSRRAARDKADMQVLPVGMARDTVAKLDAAVKAMGFKNRMAFIRDALVSKLLFEGSQQGADPAIADAADAVKAESAA
jgi:hypothetical protein